MYEYDIRTCCCIFFFAGWDIYSRQQQQQYCCIIRRSWLILSDQVPEPLLSSLFLYIRTYVVRPRTRTSLLLLCVCSYGGFFKFSSDRLPPPIHAEVSDRELHIIRTAVIRDRSSSYSGTSSCCSGTASSCSGTASTE